MRDNAKITVALVALALGGALVGNADAGNAQIASAEYFSLSLMPGTYITYTGTDPDATILVDDLTFEASLDVCNLESRCVLWDENTFGTQDIYETDNQTSGSLGAGSFSASFYERTLTRFVEAQGLEARAIVRDVDSSSVGPTFDAFTHDMYAYLAVRMREEFNTGSSFWAMEPWNTGHSTSGMSHAMAESIEVTSWATPTSQSRHYQTPHVVQNDRVLFTVVGGYANALLHVKGRVILEAGDVPVVSADLSVQ